MFKMYHLKLIFMRTYVITQKDLYHKNILIKTIKHYQVILLKNTNL